MEATGLRSICVPRSPVSPSEGHLSSISVVSSDEGCLPLLHSLHVENLALWALNCPQQTTEYRGGLEYLRGGCCGRCLSISQGPLPFLSCQGIHLGDLVPFAVMGSPSFLAALSDHMTNVLTNEYLLEILIEYRLLKKSSSS
jgi:hypothetical protein